MTARPGAEATSIVVADDYPLFVEALTQRLDQDGRFRLVGVAVNGPGVIDLCAETRPAVALVGYFLPGCQGVELLQGVLSASPDTRVVVLSGIADPDVVHTTVALGVQGYLVKQESGPAILDGLHRVGCGGAAFSRTAEACLMEAVRARAEEKGAVPSFREREILGFLTAGATTKEMAQKLFLSEPTVKTHLHRLYRKLGVSDRSAAVAEAMRRNWVS